MKRLIVLAALALAALAAAPAANAAVTVRFGTQNDGLKALLKASKALNGVTYKISYATFTSGPPLVEALSANKIDLGGVGNAPPIFGAAAGGNLKLVAAIQQRDHRDDGVIVPKDSKIKTFADLRGKRIAYTRGSSGHGFIVQALQRAGLTGKVKLVDLTPADALAAYQSGKVDAWATWDPYISIGQKILTKGARLLPSRGDYAAQGLQWEVANARSLRDSAKRAAIKDLVRRLGIALRWGGSHTNEWAKAMNAETGLPVAVAEQAIKRSLVDVLPVRGSVVSQEQTLADALARTGVVRKVRIASIVDNLVG